MKALFTNFSDFKWYLLLALPIVTAFFINKSYYDTGDSIMHYQIIRYAWLHPYLFMDHWGKPFFTLLAAPFAWLGFKYMALFNTGIIFSSAVVLFKLIKFEGAKSHIAFLTGLVFIFASNTLPIGHSGLTEPLFGFMLLLAYFWIRKGWWIAALLVVSLMPYVRTEGLIIMAIVAFYLVVNQKWRLIPYLLVGYITYGIIGLLWVYHDFNWLFTYNPYNTGAAIKYGKGDWPHYFVQYYYLNGIPFTLLTLAAIAQYFWTFRKKNAWKAFFQNQQLLLLYGCGIGFFLSHVIFWKFGIFGSFGMNRILFCIVPLAAAAIGYFFMAMHKQMQAKRYTYAYFVVLIIILLFPFSGNKSAWNYDKHFGPMPEEALMAEIVKDNPSWKNHLPIACTAPIVAECLNLDPFDKQQCLPIAGLNKANSVLWDSWFAVIEGGMGEESLLKQADSLFTLKAYEANDKLLVYGQRSKKR